MPMMERPAVVEVNGGKYWENGFLHEGLRTGYGYRRTDQ